MNSNDDKTRRERPGIDENATLREITHKARKRTINERMEWIEK